MEDENIIIDLADEWDQPENWFSETSWISLDIIKCDGYPQIFKIWGYDTVNAMPSDVPLDLESAKRLRENLDRWIRSVENSSDTLEPDTPDPR